MEGSCYLNIGCIRSSIYLQQQQLFYHLHAHRIWFSLPSGVKTVVHIWETIFKNRFPLWIIIGFWLQDSFESQWFHLITVIEETFQTPSTFNNVMNHHIRWRWNILKHYKEIVQLDLLFVLFAQLLCILPLYFLVTTKLSSLSLMPPQHKEKCE